MPTAAQKTISPSVRRTGLRLFLALIAAGQMLFDQCLAQNASPSSHPVFLTGKVDSFSVLDDDVQELLGISCNKTSKGVQIKEVRPNSEAATIGLKAGDAILDARRQGKQFILSVRRNGRMFSARLNENQKTLQAETATIDLTHQPPHKLQATQNAPFDLRASRVSMLSKYQIELMLDRSLSMRRPDCPGGLSRWDWCSYQAVSVARALAPYVPEGLTITRFASEFDVHPHATPQDVVNILGRHDFQLGTCLCEPLVDRISAYMHTRTRSSKPLLIGVITDGVPWPRPEPRMVHRALVEASQLLPQGEVTIVFFQIGGDDPRGRNYLMDLGNNLVDRGARYQYVHTVPFERLEQVGLANALVDAVQTPAAQTQNRIGMRQRDNRREW